MNKNNRLGGIKFRELGNKNSKSNEEQIKINHNRTKKDVLRLFTDTYKSTSNENPNDISDQEESYHNFDDIENKLEQFKVNITKQRNEIKLNIVNETPDFLSNCNTSTKLQSSECKKK
jgi:DNA primase catalytic subunit